ncbi:MAG: hypothetical protein ACHQ0Y_13245 [Thermodesulfovibrionales bacterium]
MLIFLEDAKRYNPLLNERAVMKVNRWQIDSKKLRVIPEDERVLFILLGHAVNEINILRKTFYLFSQFSEEPRWRAHVHTSQSLVFARILTGKLFEAWELLRKGYFGTRLSHEYDQHLDTEIKEALKSLKQYFGRDNLIDTIRNRFAFHYSPNDAKAILEHSLPNEEMVMYMAPDEANTLYYASEFVVNILTSAGVSAGIDMSLWLVGQLYSVELARKVQEVLEYYPAPPYAGEV